MCCAIPHGKTDEPIGDKGHTRDDAYVFISPQDALDRSTGGIAEGKHDRQQKKMTDMYQCACVRRKQGTDRTYECIGQGGCSADDEQGGSLTDAGVLAGGLTIAGAHFISDDDSRCQAEAPGKYVYQGRVANRRLIGCQVYRTEFGH